MSSHSAVQTFIGVTMILLLIQNSYSRNLRRLQLHRHKAQHLHKISRDDQTISRQGTGPTTVHLNTAQMFGLYLAGPYTITDDMRNKLQTQINETYKSINCKLALDDNACTRREILIARHRGNFDNNYDFHYNGFSYGNSVTGSGATYGNAIDTTYSETTHSRTSRSPKCTKGKPFDCSVNDNKKKIIQKCWLFDLYGATHHSHTSSLHSMVVQGGDLKWSDISSYMSRVGEKLLSNELHDSRVVEEFYSQIYNEIKCEIGDINVDTSKKIINMYYRQHADLIQKMHIHFHRLKYAPDDSGKHCFDHLLTFMNVLTEIAKNDDTEGEESWEDIMLIQKSFKGDKMDKFYYNNTAKLEIHFCHRQILVEYSEFVRERAIMIHNLTEKVQKESGIDTKDLESFESSFRTGILYEMTDKIFTYLVKPLFKTYLITDPEGRLSNVTDEDTMVDNACDNARRSFMNITDISPKVYWRKKANKIKRKIEREKRQRQQAS